MVSPILTMVFHGYRSPAVSHLCRLDLAAFCLFSNPCFHSLPRSLPDLTVLLFAPSFAPGHSPSLTLSLSFSLALLLYHSVPPLLCRPLALSLSCFVALSCSIALLIPQNISMAN